MPRCAKCNKIFQDKNAEVCPHCGASTQWELYFNQKAKPLIPELSGLGGVLIMLFAYLVLRQVGWLLAYGHMMNDEQICAGLAALTASVAMGSMVMFFTKRKVFITGIYIMEIVNLLYYLTSAIANVSNGTIEIGGAILYCVLGFSTSAAVMGYMKLSKRVKNTFIKD